MAKSCPICLGTIRGAGAHHGDCSRELFGTPEIPRVDFARNEVPSLIAGQADQISISGVQAKVVVALSGDRKSLVVATSGRYLLKPQIDAFAHGPENEHLTMRLARLSGLVVPPCGLVSLRDGSSAYVIKRFDRSTDEPAHKLLVEDFCSLLGLDSTGKYLGTDEDCASVIEKYTARPHEDLRRLLLQLAFAFLSGNADLHLKNLALLEIPEGGYELSPAYDLLCTGLYRQYGKEMAISINGRKIPVGREDFRALGRRHGVSDQEVDALLDQLLSKVPEALTLIERSSLPSELRSRYAHLLQKRAKMLAPRSSSRRGGQ